jgi:AcrR family transcriptional regulator
MPKQSAAEVQAPELPTRVDRRKARTRSALIGAAQALLAEGRVEVSIQEITDRADVGFGSFYNHFADKAELWDAAIIDTLRQHGDFVAAVTADLADPAEVFSVGLRVTGRLPRQFPQLAQVLANSGTKYLLSDEGLAPQALRDIRAAVATGRFDVEDAELALAMTGGSLLGLLQLLDSRPDADAEQLADEFATRVLRSCGLSRADAKKLVSRPLPQLPWD